MNPWLPASLDGADADRDHLFDLLCASVRPCFSQPAWPSTAARESARRATDSATAASAIRATSTSSTSPASHASRSVRSPSQIAFSLPSCARISRTGLPDHCIINSGVFGVDCSTAPPPPPPPPSPSTAPPQGNHDSSAPPIGPKGNATALGPPPKRNRLHPLCAACQSHALRDYTIRS
jgi:hypothetical protein